MNESYQKTGVEHGKQTISFQELSLSVNLGSGQTRIELLIRVSSGQRPEIELL
jgi:hypothetical protein